MTSSEHRLSSNPGVSTRVKLVPAYWNSYGVTYSVAERRSNELLHLHIRTSAAKPEDSLCPIMMSSLPDTLLMNKLFPAPVIPITAMTMSDGPGVILAVYALAETRRGEQVGWRPPMIVFDSFDSKNSAIKVLQAQRVFSSLPVKSTRSLVKEAPNRHSGER